MVVVVGPTPTTRVEGQQLEDPMAWNGNGTLDRGSRCYVREDAGREDDGTGEICSGGGPYERRVGGH